MTTNIIIGGVGGQGILTIAGIIDLAAMQQGLFLKQSEVHGMSQRGGAVESHLRISDKEIYSALIPTGKADLILSIEPMESLRYLPFLAPEGIIVTAIEPYINIPNYPEPEIILNEIRKHRHLLVDAEALAHQAGNAKAFNLVMLGAASPYLGIASPVLEDAITERFIPKGTDTVKMNLEAFRLGAAHAKG